MEREDNDSSGGDDTQKSKGFRASGISSEERYRLLFDTMLQGVVHQDAAGYVIEMNPAAERILGKTRQEVLGVTSSGVEQQTIREDGTIFPGMEHPSMVALQTGAPVRDVTMGVWHPHYRTYRWIKIDAVPIFREGESLPCEVYAVFEDITEQRLARQQLIEADRYKDEFLAILAHELRNPLAPLRAAVDSCQLDSTNTELVTKSLEVMDRQINHMSRLMEDLLDVSRANHRQLELRLENLSLQRVMQEALEASQPWIQCNNLKVIVNLPLNPVMLLADPVRLSQLFSNIINNAAKYSRVGNQIEITATCGTHDVVVDVKDYGIGITRENLTKIFERFVQVSPAKGRSQGGLGIGLYLVKAIAELHHGSVEALSEGIDRGATFRVRLPVIPAFDQPASAVARNFNTTQRSARVMVVDDLPDNVNSLALLLSLLGHQVHKAYTGLEAVDVFKRFAPEMVFLDIGLPDIDGYEVARRIRQLSFDRKVHIIAVTGWARDEDRERSAEAGMDVHLPKPVSLQELVHCLELLI